ncbi:MAG TPA: aminotransferase class III-fold pyridoxal phosphate-dependent enzyme [Pyrinomonadaceae bacterium]|jgi:putrescine aminotransferase|nr:aminotransferase class III-fold pyridoxal phosphate-dependent enzyme [Pyrinomonadaceae bacterium]
MSSQPVTRHPSIEKYARHVNPQFVKLLGVYGYGRVFERARDVWVWDHQGRQYLDLLAGFGSVNVGHNHPRLTERLREFLAAERMNFCHVGPAVEAAELAEALAGAAGASLRVSLFSSGGAEAVEAGMKLARAATRREGFVFCRQGFHGTSFGTLSVMGSPRLRKPFEPLLGDCRAVGFGDLDALERALSRGGVAGFVVEPVQGEGGVVTPPAGYLKEAQALCRRHGALLILDEIQTGLGRTGTMFAYEAEGFTPDVLVLAKSLSGGVAPIGATLTSEDVFGRAYGSLTRFDLHSSTFGGNAFSCVAGLETLRIVADEDLPANAAARGAQLLAGLREKLAGHPLVRDIRGRGLLVGIELGPTEDGLLNRVAPSLVGAVSQNVFGQWAALKLLERGMVCQPASQAWNVLRLEPPLTVREAEVNEAVESVAGVLGEYRGIAPLLKDVARRLGGQWQKGWAFE